MADFKKRITEFHYGKFSLGLFLLFSLPSFFYYIVINAKNFLYNKKILKEGKVPTYVICVGNLTTGGVGKTPVVIEIANHLSKNKKVAILSRGYGGKLKKGAVHLIKDYEKQLIHDVDLIGDEVALISKKTNNCAVIVSTDRFKGGFFAKEKLNADVVIMDDGFSNRKIYKDYSIILIDENKLFGNNFCLPLGALREPVSELKRGNKILFVNKDGIKNKNLEKIQSKIENYETANMKNGRIYNIVDFEEIKEKDILAFSAIGQPEQFYAKLNEFNIKEKVSFDDHYKYSEKDIRELNEKMLKAGAKALVTTEKDMVKLLKFNNINSIYALELKVEADIDKILS